MSCYVNIDDESSGHSTARTASLSSSLLLKSSSAALSSSKKRKLPTMDGGSLSGVAMKVRGLLYVVIDGCQLTRMWLIKTPFFYLILFAKKSRSSILQFDRCATLLMGDPIPRRPRIRHVHHLLRLILTRLWRRRHKRFSALLDRCRTFYSAAFKTAVLCRHGRRIVLCTSSSCGCERSGGLG